MLDIYYSLIGVLYRINQVASRAVDGARVGRPIYPQGAWYFPGELALTFYMLETLPISTKKWPVQHVRAWARREP
jgi:hypothetical protein